jgi:hypothetical protein
VNDLDLEDAMTTSDGPVRRQRAGRVERPGPLAGSPAGSAQRSRRDLLRWAALAGGTFAFAELLAACGAGTGGATGGPARTTSDGTLRGLWDGLLSQLRVWAGSVNLPL